MRLSGVKFHNHPILKDLELNFTNGNGGIYANIILVGENGCGKTTILNELFNYESTQFIIAKEENYNLCGKCSRKSLFISQDIKYKKAINNICRDITGSNERYPDMTEIDNTNGFQGANIMTLCKNNVVNSNKLLLEKLRELEDDNIINYFESSNKDLMLDVSQIVGIREVENPVRSDKYSSGEQELILRLESLKNRVQSNLDSILIDEPETSLHPKWQLKILSFILDILKDNNSGERDLQLFIATHSENILKSAMGLPDTLIIRLYREDSIIKAQYISTMKRALSFVSYPEIQYLVFDVPTIDYHNQLYSVLFDRCNSGNPKKMCQNKVEEFIKSYGEEMGIDIFNPNRYSYRRDSEFETLPTYIRNASSHPENIERSYNDNDLLNSICLMRKILLNDN